MGKKTPIIYSYFSYYLGAVWMFFLRLLGGESWWRLMGLFLVIFFKWMIELLDVLCIVQ